MRNVKSQSTIIGSLIVIVITVTLGITVLSWGMYVFTTQQTGFNSIFYTKTQMIQDNFNIEYINQSPPNTMTVWIGNYGQTDVQIVGITVYNSTYIHFYKYDVIVPPSGLAKVTIIGLKLVKGSVYNVEVIASDGSTVVSET